MHDTSNELMHYGVKGMTWGKTKQEDPQVAPEVTQAARGYLDKYNKLKKTRALFVSGKASRIDVAAAKEEARQAYRNFMDTRTRIDEERERLQAQIQNEQNLKPSYADELEKDKFTSEPVGQNQGLSVGRNDVGTINNQADIRTGQTSAGTIDNQAGIRTGQVDRGEVKKTSAIRTGQTSAGIQNNKIDRKKIKKSIAVRTGKIDRGEIEKKNEQLKLRTRKRARRLISLYKNRDLMRPK